MFLLKAQLRSDHSSLLQWPHLRTGTCLEPLPPDQRENQVEAFLFPKAMLSSEAGQALGCNSKGLRDCCAGLELAPD